MPPTNNPWLYIGGLLVSLLSGIGLKDIVIAIFKRKPARVIEVANQIDLAKQAQAYAEQLEQDAAASRASAQQSWKAVNEANQRLVRAYSKLDESTWKFEQAARYLDSLFAKIWDPAADIEAVRSYVRSRPVPYDRTGNNNGQS